MIEAESVKNKLPQKLSDTVELLDALLYLNELLCSVFAELEVVVEVLNKDEEDLRSLKSTLLQLRDKVQIANDQQSEKERLEEQKKFYIRTVFVAQSQSRPTKGCYVATAIYGSYNCPQVWVLRRYRDNVLAHNFFGRIFIKIYYFLSPTAVKIFGKTKLFNFLARKLLDKKVCKLKKRKFADMEYFV